MFRRPVRSRSLGSITPISPPSLVTLICLLVLPIEVHARDFVLRPIAEPGGTVIDSGRWISNDVTPRGEHHVAFVREVERDFVRIGEIVVTSPGQTVIAGTGVAGTLGFVNMEAHPEPYRAVYFQKGVPSSQIGYPGQTVHGSSAPSWFTEQLQLGLLGLDAAQYPAVDGAATFERIAYYAVASSFGTGAAVLVHARFSSAGYVWEAIDTEVQVFRDRGRLISIERDQLDRSRIAYLKDDDTLQYAWFDGSNWNTEVVFDQAGQSVAHVDLALDGAGLPHVSFYLIDSQDLMYATRDHQGNWSVETASFNGRVGKWSSIAIDPAGVPHIACRRDSDLSLILVSPAPGGTWDDEIVDGIGFSHSVGEYASLAIDAYGAFHIAYYDATNDRPRYAWWMDWNGNGVHDATDIANGLLSDCDGNEIPDQAELLYGFAQDANANGVLDACEPDCDGDGVSDAIEIAADPSLDCDLNGVLDDCQSLWTEGALSDGGFETQEPGAFPTTFGVWGQDVADAVTAENGVVPIEGEKMLKFLATYRPGTSFDGRSSDIVQFIGLCEVPGVDAGTVQVAASAKFNSVVGDAETDRQFTILVQSYAGSPSSIDPGAYLATSSATVISDADPTTWETLSTTLALPSGSDYVAVWVYASEDVFNDFRVDEFDGHYCDDVRVQIFDSTQTAAPIANSTFRMRAPHPNPFSGSTALQFELPRSGQVELRVFDLKGRLVRELGVQELPAGRSLVTWDGRDERGHAIASGVYLLRARLGRDQVTRRVTVIR